MHFVNCDIMARERALAKARESAAKKPGDFTALSFPADALRTKAEQDMLSKILKHVKTVTSQSSVPIYLSDIAIALGRFLYSRLPHEAYAAVESAFLPHQS